MRRLHYQFHLGGGGGRGENTETSQGYEELAQSHGGTKWLCQIPAHDICFGV